MATQLVNATLAGRSFNLKAGLARLRALAERRRAPRGKLLQTARSFLSWVIPKRRFAMPWLAPRLS
jgi:hypothetical protein